MSLAFSFYFNKKFLIYYSISLENNIAYLNNKIPLDKKRFLFLLSNDKIHEKKPILGSFAFLLSKKNFDVVNKKSSLSAKKIAYLIHVRQKKS